MSYLYVPGMEGLNSGSDSPPDFWAERCESSVWWRGKPSQQRTWSRRWKTASWIRRLSGLTLLRSLSFSGVDSWIWSSGVSRASRSPMLERGKELLTQGGSGPPSGQPVLQWERRGSFWRKYQGSSEEVCLSSSKTLPKRGGLVNGIISRREKREPAIKGSGCLSWATPDTAPEAPNSGSNVKIRSGSLGVQAKQTTEQAAQWPTPNNRDGDKSHKRAPGHKRQVNLSGRAFHFSLPAPPTSPPGNGCSTAGRKLNPLFVEWLMGIVPGWTDLDWLEMGSFLSWQRTHTSALRRMLGCLGKEKRDRDPGDQTRNRMASVEADDPSVSGGGSNRPGSAGPLLQGEGAGE